MGDLIRFNCPACGKSIKARADHAGRQAKCPGRGCGRVVRIPEVLSLGPDGPDELEPLPEPRRAGPWLIAGAAGLLLLIAAGVGVWLLTRDGDRVADATQPPDDRPPAANPPATPPSTPPSAPSDNGGSRTEQPVTPKGPDTPPAKPKVDTPGGEKSGGSKPADPPAAKGVKIAEIRRFEGGGSNTSFSPDGKRVVSVSYKLELFEWEVATGQEVRRLPAQENYKEVATSPDFRYALAVERPDPKALGKLHLWDLAAGKSIRSWPEPKGEWETYGPAGDFSPDAASVVTLYQEPVVRRLPDGGISIGGDPKKEVFLWDARKGEAVKMPPLRVDGAVIFSPDGKSLLTDDPDDNVILWDAKTGKPLKKYAGAPGSPVRLFMSADGKYVAASCLRDKKYSVIVWDAGTEKVVRKIESLKTFARGVAFAPDGRTLLTAEAGEPEDGVPPAFRLWDIATGRELGSLVGEKGLRVYSVTFAPDGASFVSAGDLAKKGLVQVWSVRG